MWVMRTILHDWSDEESSQILSTLRAAIGATSVTLAIVEVCSHLAGSGFINKFPTRDGLVKTLPEVEVRESC